MKKIFAIVALCCMSFGAFAQDLGGSLGLESTHLWRGLEVSSGLTLDADLHLNAGGFTVGMWSGREFTSGGYKEFDYYASYSKNGFSVSVWDIYNYTADYSEHQTGTHKEIFNYNKFQTNHFIDAGVAYNFGASCNLPLTLSWNTIVQGRDLDGDTQQYSSYFKAAYTVYQDENWTVTPSIGGSTKFAGDSDNNFYGGTHKTYINDVTLNATYKAHIGSYELPVTATVMWSPEFKDGYYGVTVNLLSF